MTVLIYGANTNTGQYLAQVDGVVAVDHALVDPFRPADCARLLRDVSPKAVIYLPPPIGHTGANADPARAHAALSGTPSAIAVESAILNVPLVTVSSCEVFDGTLPMSYVSSDPMNAETVLGQAYQSGELAVAASGCTYAILRSSWVFGANIENDLARFVSNHPDRAVHAAPTPAMALAQAILTIAGSLVTQPQKTGTYHFAGDVAVSLVDFERQIALANRNYDMVSMPRDNNEVSCNHRLDCRTTKAVFGLDRPDWGRALNQRALEKIQPRQVSA